MELAYTTVLKTVACKGLRVRVPPEPPTSRRRTMPKVNEKPEKILSDFKHAMEILADASPLAANVETEIVMYAAMCKVFLKKVASA